MALRLCYTARGMHDQVRTRLTYTARDKQSKACDKKVAYLVAGINRHIYKRQMRRDEGSTPSNLSLFLHN
jgi:hypothetical protein